MYALTLTQPWAALVASGRKLVENRDWAPPRSQLALGERFAIHAAKSFDLDVADKIRAIIGGAAYNALPGLSASGAVIAVARLVDVVTAVERVADIDQRVWFFGPYGWVLSGVVSFPPVPCRGLQKLWQLPSVVERQVRDVRDVYPVRWAP